MTGKSIIIIGAGMAGLCAGCYAQMNGYKTRIFEMHSLPGGLCTSWKRKGYTIDGSAHYLIGSGPGSGFYKYWNEVGLIQGRQFVDHDALQRVEGRDGRTFVFYADTARLEKHMLDLSPADRPVIQEFIAGMRFFDSYDPPIDAVPEIMGPIEGLKMLAQMAPTMKPMQKWSKLSIQDFANRFEDPLIREGFTTSLRPEFPMMLLMMTLAWLNRKAAGYPIGGSLPMARAIEQRFLRLGGEIHYNARVDKILVEGNRAVGVRLAATRGSEHRADVVISAADGHATLFDMLEGKFLDEKTRQTYQETPVFPSLMYISLGVNRTFDEPYTSSGTSFPLEQPVQLGDGAWDRLPLRILNYDPTLAPAGKTVLIVSPWTSYTYWKELSADPARYEAKKQEIVRKVIEVLDRRYPGLAGQVEMADLATPLTYERYTGNWQGSTQGWLHNTQNALAQMSKTLPGLKDFYLIGQWVEPGGGFPGGIRSGRNVVRIICKKDKVAFRTSVELSES